MNKMICKKVFSAFLSIALVATGIQVPWNGCVAEAAEKGEYTGGSVNSGDIYTVSSKETLELLANKVNDGYDMKGVTFELTEDIALNTGTISADIDTSNGTCTPKYNGNAISGSNQPDEWTSIGDYVSEYAFKGTFDGKEHTISGLYVNNPDASGVGLFGYISGATIKNVNINNAYVEGNECVGLLVGETLYDGEMIINCNCEGTVYCGLECVGGLVAECETVYNCSFVGNVSSAGNYVGGIAGLSDVYGSYFRGTVYGRNNTGGIVGVGMAIYSYVEANVYSNGSKIGIITGDTSSSSGKMSQYDYYGVNSKLINNGITMTSVPLYSGNTDPVDTIYSATTAQFKDGTVAASLQENMEKENLSDITGVTVYWAQAGNYPYLTTEKSNGIVVEKDWTTAAANSSYAFSGGNGTKESPYIIANAYDLRMLALNVQNRNDYSGKYFKQNADIALNSGNVSGELIKENADVERYIAKYNYAEVSNTNKPNEWTAIGTDINAQFAGNYDGDGYNISGIYINSESDNQGMFGYVGVSNIKNVNVNNSYISGNKYCGGIVGKTSGSAVVESCTYTGYIVSSGGNSGGILGYSNNEAKVNKCVNNGTIYSTAPGIGGIAYDTDCSGCINNGSVTAYTKVDTVEMFAAGIVVLGNAESCVNNGAIKNAGGVTGGIVARRYSAINCVNTGIVVGMSQTGGISGNDTVISNCYTTAGVRGSSNISNSDYTGVVVGRLSESCGTVSNTFYLATATKIVDGSQNEKCVAYGASSENTIQCSTITQSELEDGILAYTLSLTENGKWGQDMSRTGSKPMPMLADSTAKAVRKLTFYYEDGESEIQGVKPIYANEGDTVTLPSEYTWSEKSGVAVTQGKVTVGSADLNFITATNAPATVKESIEDYTVKVSENNISYDRTEKTPEFTVESKDGKNILVKNTDYQYQYSDNKLLVLQQLQSQVSEIIQELLKEHLQLVKEHKTCQKE